MDHSNYQKSQGSVEESSFPDVAAGGSSSNPYPVSKECHLSDRNYDQTGKNQSSQATPNETSKVFNKATSEKKSQSNSNYHLAHGRKRKLTPQKVPSEWACQDASFMPFATNLPPNQPRPKKCNDEKRKEQNRKAAIASRYRKSLLLDELQDSIKFFEKMNREQKKNNEHLENCIQEAQQYIEINNLKPVTTIEENYQAMETRPDLSLEHKQGQSQLQSMDAIQPPRHPQQVHEGVLRQEVPHQNLAPLTEVMGTTMDAMIAFQMAVDATIGQKQHQHQRNQSSVALDPRDATSPYSKKAEDDFPNQFSVNSGSSIDNKHNETNQQQETANQQQHPPMIAMNPSGGVSNFHDPIHQLVAASANQYVQPHPMLLSTWQQLTHQAPIWQQQPLTPTVPYLQSMFAQNPMQQQNHEQFSQMFLRASNASLALPSVPTISPFMLSFPHNQQASVQQGGSQTEQDRQQHIVATARPTDPTSDSLRMMEYPHSSYHNYTIEQATAATNNMWAAAAAMAAAVASLASPAPLPPQLLPSHYHTTHPLFGQLPSHHHRDPESLEITPQTNPDEAGGYAVNNAKSDRNGEPHR